MLFHEFPFCYSLGLALIENKEDRLLTYSFVILFFSAKADSIILPLEKNTTPYELSQVSSRYPLKFSAY
jgi:hypothetical protein